MEYHSFEGDMYEEDYSLPWQNRDDSEYDSKLQHTEITNDGELNLCIGR